jgi:hypothetical protein
MILDTVIDEGCSVQPIIYMIIIIIIISFSGVLEAASKGQFAADDRQLKVR